MSDKTETEPVRIPYKSQQVTRFNIVYDEMQEHDDGEYVLWQDYDRLRAEVAQLRAENQNLLSMIADGTPMQSDDYTRGEDSAKTCIAQLRVEGERLKAILENQGWLPLRPISWPENLTWEEGYAPVLPEEGIIYIQIKNERMQFQVLDAQTINPSLS